MVKTKKHYDHEDHKLFLINASKL